MNNRQAIKEAIKWGKEVRKRYIFGANSYRSGIEVATFERESDRVKKIDDVISQLEQLWADLDTIYRARPSKPPQPEQLSLWEE